ncbi:MAG: two-component regulator propeller domain-containing protein [archaeon]
MNYSQRNPLPNKYLLKKIAVFLGIMFVATSVFSQITEPIEFENIPFGEDIKNIGVLSIFQDRFGFLWLTTFNGLYRCNGNEFKRFYHLENDTTSIPGNRIISIMEDRNGGLWVGASNGYLSKFNRKNETFTNYKIVTKTSKTQTTFIMNILEGDSNDLWMHVGNVIIRFDIRTKTKRSYFLPDESKSDMKAIYQVFKDSQNRLWIVAGKGLYQYKPAIDRIELVNEELFKYVNDKNIWVIYEDRKHGFWFGSRDKYFYHYDPITKSFQTFSNPPVKNAPNKKNGIRCFSEDASGTIWFGNTTNGLSMLDQKTGTIYNSASKNSPFLGITLYHIQALYIDNGGTIWIGNTNKGLFKSRSKNRFIAIHSDKSSPNSLADNRIKQIIEDKNGAVWIGTSLKGLDCWDMRSGQFHHFKHDPRDSLSINSDKITSLLQDHLGNLWVGTLIGLNRFDPPTKRFFHYPFQFAIPNKNKKNLQFITTLYEDNNETLWVGSYTGGLIEFQPKTNKYWSYVTPPTNGVDPNTINTICEDKNGNLWIGVYEYGIRIFDKNKKKFIREYHHSPEEFNSIPNHMITRIFRDKQKNIWVGTIAGGLCRFNEKTNDFTRFTEKDGLISSDIIDIAEDDFSNLWLLTHKGLTKFNIPNLSCTNFDENDNLVSHLIIPEKQNYGIHVNVGDITRLKNGHFLIGSSNGLVYFNPQEIIKHENTAPVYLTSFRIFNKEINADSAFWITKNLRLSHRDKIFSFEISHLDFIDPDKNQFAYYLDGFEKDWNPPTYNRIVQYMNVPPGRYVFRAKAANANGVWSKQQLSVRVIIKPPYWKTWWFKITSTLLLGLIVFGIFWMRLLAIKRQKIELENTVTERTLELNEKKEALQVARDELEQRVIERTSELVKTNEDLLNEITERKRTEYALQNSERTTRALLNAPPDSAMLLSPDGRILAINAPLLDMIGKPGQQTEDFIGLSIFGFNPPARLSQRKENFQKCIQSRKPVQFEDISNNRTLAHFIYPITDSEGGINAIAIYSRDVTDQKEAEKILKQSKEDLEILVGERTVELNKTNQQLVKEIKVRKLTEENLRVSEEQFRDLFENANDAIWTSDVKGNFTSVNIFLESLIGYTKDELLKMNPTEIIAPEHRFRLMHNFMKVAHGQSAGIEIEVLPKDGVRKILWLRFRPIWNHSDVVGIHGIGRDITNLRRAEENLKRAENQKRESLKEVTLKIAHEIKNPLASIKSSAQLVLSSPDYGEIPNIKRHMEIINRNTDVCNRVIRELYNFTTQLEFKVNQIDADEFIDKLTAYATQKAGADRKIQIVVNKDPKFVSFEGDEFRLIQVFNNIINNAVEAIRSDGEINIDICLKNAGKMVSFAIKDTGEGISESNLKNIFKPFFTSKPAGFGLGLTYAREIIKFHDGDIEVTSEVGKGTTFQIMIPVKQEKKI